jgi:arsenical pump membrane protein
MRHDMQFTGWFRHHSHTSNSIRFCRTEKRAMVGVVKVKLIKTLLNVTAFRNFSARRVKQKRRDSCASGQMRYLTGHVAACFCLVDRRRRHRRGDFAAVCGERGDSGACRRGFTGGLRAAAARRGITGGSAAKLFFLIYGMGVVVTVFLSNDATAVVLTPAVAAAARQAKAANPLPYLLACAFIANAASFVLPISNPANLVIYQSQMPDLARWLAQFSVPSIVAVIVTFWLLRWTERRALRQPVEVPNDRPSLSRGGAVAGIGIICTAIVLTAASAFGLQLGLPTALAGATTVGVVAIREPAVLGRSLKDVSWSTLALVAGLFVLVTGVQSTGVIGMLAQTLRAASPATAAWGAGVIIAFVCNLLNNLPAGLIAGTAIAAAHAPDQVRGAALIGIDLGPNLSVTGSLATILWLTALRREGLDVSAWTFLKRGALVMPVALILALAALLL